MNSLGTPSSEEVRRSSAPLSIENDAQNDLAHRIYRLSTDLQESPLVIPDYTETVLNHIPLRARTKNKPGSHLNISTGTIEGALSHATLTTTDATKRTGSAQVLYTYNPGAQLWEAWNDPSATEPNAAYSNVGLIDELDSQLPDEIFESLYDTIPTGPQIVSLLVGHLSSKARTNARQARYSSHVPIVGPDFFTPRSTELFVQKNNRKVQQALFVSAVYASDYGSIEKSLSYGISLDSGVLQGGGGVLSYKSGSYMPQTRLNMYAKNSDESFAKTVFDHGVNELRRRYDVHDSQSAQPGPTEQYPRRAAL